MGILNVKSDYPPSANASGSMRDDRYLLGNMNAILEDIARQNVENAKFLRGMSRKLEEGINRMEEASVGGVESGSAVVDKALLTELRDEIKKELEQIKVQDVHMPELDTEQLAAQMAEQIGGQLGSQISGQLSNQMAQQVAGQVTVHMAQQMSGRMAQQVSQQVSQQVTSQLSGQMSQQVANQVSAQMSQQLAEQVSAQMSQQLTEQVSAQMSQQVAEQLSGRMLQQVSEQVSYEVSSQIAQQTQQLSGQLVPQFTQHMEQVVANQLTQQVAQQSAQVMQQMMQQLSVELAQQMSRQISQQVSVQVAEQMRQVSHQYVPGQEQTIVMYDDAKLNEIDSKLARVTTLPSMMKNLIESTNDATVKKVDQVVADQNAKSFFEIQAMRKMVRITLWVSLIAAGLAIINFL